MSDFLEQRDTCANNDDFLIGLWCSFRCCGAWQFPQMPDMSSICAKGDTDRRRPKEYRMLHSAELYLLRSEPILQGDHYIVKPLVQRDQSKREWPVRINVFVS